MRPRALLRGVAEAAFFVVLGACDPDPPAPSLPSWRLAERADVVVGAAGSEPLFGRVAGARRLENGRFFVTDRQAREAWLFDSAGALLKRVAWAGRGPGELAVPSPPLPIEGDTIAIVDLELRRIMLFDGDGNHLRTRAYVLQATDGYLAPVGLVSSAELVGLLLGLERPATAGDRVTRTAKLVRSRIGSFETTSIAEGRGTELAGGAWSEGGEVVVGAYEVPFGRTTLAAVGPERILLGDTDRPRLEVFDHRGRRTGAFEWTEPADAVTDDDRASWLARESTAVSSGAPGAAEQRASMAAALRDLGFARTHRVFTGLVVGDDRSVWIEQDRRQWLPSRRFLVLSPEGKALATVEVPRALLVQQADLSSVTGIWREPGSPDEIRSYRLER